MVYVGEYEEKNLREENNNSFWSHFYNYSVSKVFSFLHVFSIYRNVKLLIQKNMFFLLLLDKSNVILTLCSIDYSWYLILDSTDFG